MEKKKMKFICPGILLVLIISSSNALLEEESSGLQTSFDNGTLISSLKYFAQFGYLQESRERNLSLLETFETAVKSFQKFFKISPTGVLDETTVSAMKKPRCGLVDEPQNNMEDDREVIAVGLGEKERVRRKRFSFFDSFFNDDFLDMFGTRMREYGVPHSKWRASQLTYRQGAFIIVINLVVMKIIKDILTILKKYALLF